MRRVVVIGGGISGLAAARLLAGARPVSAAGNLGDLGNLGSSAGNLGSATAGAGQLAGDMPGAGDSPAWPSLDGEWSVVLLEASDRLGGKICTSDGKTAFELGPDQFLRRDPSAVKLCTALGLADNLVEPAAGTAAVFARGTARQLPAGLVLGVPTNLEALAASGVVSGEAVEFAASEHSRLGPMLTGADVGLEPSAEAPERSGGAIMRPRLGNEIVDNLIDPLLGGINAGSIDKLSLGTAAPQIATALVGHHDVIAPLAQASPPAYGRQPAANARPNSPFYGLAGGLGQLVAAAGRELEDLGVDVRLGTPALAIAADGSGYAVKTSKGAITAEAIVLAVPAFAGAECLRNIAPEAAASLDATEYASVVVTTLQFRPGANAHVEGWTGLLVPRAVGGLATGITYLSYKWPWTCSADSGPRVRISAGRLGDTRATSLKDSVLVKRLADELKLFTGLSADHCDATVTRWDKSFPQYTPGFRARLQTLRHGLSQAPGVAVAGACLGGIGIPACITSGEQAVVDLIKSLASAGAGGGAGGGATTLPDASSGC